MTGNHIKIPIGPARQCARCGALGTHYLTCPILRLPRGYRFGDPAVSTPVTLGEQRITRRPAADDSSSAGAIVYRLLVIRAEPGRAVRRGDGGK